MRPMTIVVVREAPAGTSWAVFSAVALAADGASAGAAEAVAGAGGAVVGAEAAGAGASVAGAAAAVAGAGGAAFSSGDAGTGALARRRAPRVDTARARRTVIGTPLSTGAKTGGTLTAPPEGVKRRRAARLPS